jgi:glycosyltransferase involved in cell wall biosynthesis
MTAPLRAPFISFIIPIYNEAEQIAHFIATLASEIIKHTPLYEIIIVDDGSADHSLEIVSQLIGKYPLKALSFSRNFGKEIALTAGLEHAEGDIAILMDADFQHPFGTIKIFLDKWQEGYDMVYGVRTSRENESWLKKKFTRFFYGLSSHLSEVSIPVDAGDFRLVNRKIIDALKKMPEHNRFMKGLYAWVGFKSIGVPFVVQDRVAGKSHWTFARLLGLGLNGLFSFSNLPLRVWSLIGLIISGISFIYALWIVFTVLYFGIDLPGFATLTVAIMFFGGIQLLSIGILGEYIGRIFTEVKRRPNYLISKKMGFKAEVNLETSLD